MFQGFYNLSGQMLTQTRNLNVISSNMANISTPGYKNDTLVSGAFAQELISRIGNKDKSPVPVGNMYLIKSAFSTTTDYEDGAIQSTESPFDFALEGNGFFVVQTDDGEVYTRDGSFSLDEEGYLILPSVGRVQGIDGAIQFDTDQFTVDRTGTIYREDGSIIGQLQIVDFADYDQDLLKNGKNVFEAVGGAEMESTAVIHWMALEQSNVDPVEEMTAMMESQRSLQSAAQVLSMYDQLMEKMMSQLGPA